jgi:uncharacterized protein YjbI with pentapeptide repeats
MTVLFGEGRVPAHASECPFCGEAMEIEAETCPHCSGLPEKPTLESAPDDQAEIGDMLSPPDTANGRPAQTEQTSDVESSAIQEPGETTPGDSRRADHYEIVLHWDGVRNLRGFDLTECNLSGFELQNADLCGANLLGGDLRGADLRGADPCGADLDKANVSKAELHGANLSWTGLSGADLYYANLSEANLNVTNLSRANLNVADLSGADLNGAYLGRANLCGVYLGGAYMGGAALSEAVLS